MVAKRGSLDVALHVLQVRLNTLEDQNESLQKMVSDMHNLVKTLAVTGKKHFESWILEQSFYNCACWRRRQSSSRESRCCECREAEVEEKQKLKADKQDLREADPSRRQSLEKRRRVRFAICRI